MAMSHRVVRMSCLVCSLFCQVEGSIIEINNGAKHYVHNASAIHRVHLIFDWVEKEHLPLISPNPPVLLAPGTMSHQVRGCIQFITKEEHARLEAVKKDMVAFSKTYISNLIRVNGADDGKV